MKNTIKKDIKKEQKKEYGFMRHFKIIFSCKKLISKMYLRNNIEYKDFKYMIKPNYKNKEIKIKIKRVKK